VKVEIRSNPAIYPYGRFEKYLKQKGVYDDYVKNFSFGEKYIKPDDEIIISTLEHHANIVPWQMMCGRKKAKLKMSSKSTKLQLSNTDDTDFVNCSISS
jgi:hypothetical protein